MSKKSKGKLTDWAQLRFSIIGGLLASPPQKGDLRKELRAQHARRRRQTGDRAIQLRSQLALDAQEELVTEENTDFGGFFGIGKLLVDGAHHLVVAVEHVGDALLDGVLIDIGGDDHR